MLGEKVNVPIFCLNKFIILKFEAGTLVHIFAYDKQMMRIYDV